MKLRERNGAMVIYKYKACFLRSLQVDHGVLCEVEVAEAFVSLLPVKLSEVEVEELQCDFFYQIKLYSFWTFPQTL